MQEREEESWREDKKKKSHKGGKRQKNMEYVALPTKEDNVNKEEKDEHSHML